MPTKHELMCTGRSILLARMDKAFALFYQQAEALSVLLAQEADPSSWTRYSEILRQRTAELVAYENYRKIQDELFKLVTPPSNDGDMEFRR